jgi:hypothetical protein
VAQFSCPVAFLTVGEEFVNACLCPCKKEKADMRGARA